MDISDPSDPVLLASYDTAGVCYDILSFDRFLICADGLNGFVIMDVQDTTFPKKITDGYDLGSVLDVARFDLYLYSASGRDGLFVTDFSDPYIPYTVKALDPQTVRFESGQLKAVATFPGYMLTADSAGGITLFDLENPTIPLELASEPYLRGDPVKLSYSTGQNVAYVASQIAGMYIYSIATEAEPADSVDGVWIGSGAGPEGLVGIAAEPVSYTHLTLPTN